MDWSVLNKKLSEIKWVYYVPIFILLCFILIFPFFKFNAAINYIKDLDYDIEVKREGPVRARGIYISSWTAGEEEKIERLADFILNTKLNAVVIDIKDVTGKISYQTNLRFAKENHLYKPRIKDIEKLLKFFKNKGIYVIGRICVFKDDTLSKKMRHLSLKNKDNNEPWKDSSGLMWVDPASEKVWEYNINLAKEALNLGFEEINFDYIRFPSSGNLGNINYPIWKKEKSRQEIIKSFFSYQHDHLKEFRVSADLFGITMSHVLDGFDVNIGQRFEDAVPFFDYICPMLYPSYFQGAFDDIKNPAEKPYEVIDRSFESSKSIIKKGEKPFIRPWIQAFFTKNQDNDINFLKLQKQALLDNDSYGFLLWNSRNDYFDFQDIL